MLKSQLQTQLRHVLLKLNTVESYLCPNEQGIFLLGLIKSIYKNE
jgi:hypothetical protein